MFIHLLIGSIAKVIAGSFGDIIKKIGCATLIGIFIVLYIAIKFWPIFLLIAALFIIILFLNHFFTNPAKSFSQQRATERDDRISLVDRLISEKRYSDAKKVNDLFLADNAGHEVALQQRDKIKAQIRGLSSSRCSRCDLPIFSNPAKSFSQQRATVRDDRVSLVDRLISEKRYSDAKKVNDLFLADNAGHEIALQQRDKIKAEIRSLSSSRCSRCGLAMTNCACN